MVIYKITNLINGKIYIGQTIKPIQQRFKEHCNAKSNCSILRKAIHKYGKENFSIKTLIVCKNEKELNEREKFCIRLFNSLKPNGYNISTGGENYRTPNRDNSFWTPEYRKLRGEKFSGVNNPSFGRVVSKSTKLKISASLKGRKPPITGKKQTEESKRKMSETKMKLRKEGKRTNGKHVINIITKEIVISARIAAEKQGISSSGMTLKLNNKTKNDTPWRWLDDKNPTILDLTPLTLGKVSFEIAEQIRADYKTGQFTYHELGLKYSISSGNVCSIINYKTWKPKNV